MKSKVNFHIHTVHSDGGKTVEEIVKELKAQGVEYFAITDHDSIDGVEEAMCLAKEYGMHCVSGVEITALFYDSSLFGPEVKGLDYTCVGHVLALDFDVEKMRKLLFDYRLSKEQRIIALTYSLIRDGYNICKENIFTSGLNGRTDVAKELVRAGYATDVSDAFEHILNLRDYRMVSNLYSTISDVIRDIKNCGGLSVLAHPFGYTRGGKKEMSKEQVLQYIGGYKREIVDAVEVYYQNYDVDKIEFIKELADKYGLMASIGTDYHHSPVDLQKYPQYAEKLKRETLCFDVDGVTADESIIRVIEARKNTKYRMFDLEKHTFDDTRCRIGASIKGLELKFSEIFTTSTEDGCDQSAATYALKNLNTLKFLDKIGCSISDDDETLGKALKAAYDKAKDYPQEGDKFEGQLERMLRYNGANYTYFVERD